MQYQGTPVSAVCCNVVVLSWYFIIESMSYMHELHQTNSLVRRNDNYLSKLPDADCKVDCEMRHKYLAYKQHDGMIASWLYLTIRQRVRSSCL